MMIMMKIWRGSETFVEETDIGPKTFLATLLFAPESSKVLKCLLDLVLEFVQEKSWQQVGKWLLGLWRTLWPRFPHRTQPLFVVRTTSPAL